MTTIHKWLAHPLPEDVARAIERISRWDDVQHIAVMPDVHLSAHVCNGLVIATQHLLYPQAVGGDIGCGMAALAFDAPAEALKDQAPTLLDALPRLVPTNRLHRPVDLLPDLADRPLSHPALNSLKREARVQLGTLGRGNHFLEFQSDDDGRLWIMVHTGSRAIGQAIRDWHTRAQTCFDAASPAGQAYLADAAWAVDYARANRRAILLAAAQLLERQFNLQSLPNSAFDTVHNFVRVEQHVDRTYYVHRKGAMSAQPGEPGIIPGSMGTRSYHVEGRGCPQSLCSSAHGAGRQLSRDQARRQISARSFRAQMHNVHYDPSKTVQLRDEAPAAYKDITAIMRAQRALVKVARTLIPILVHKGT